MRRSWRRRRHANGHDAGHAAPAEPHHRRAPAVRIDRSARRAGAGRDREPAPTNSTSTSLIWTLSNPAVGEPLTLTVEVALQNFVAPAPIRHLPGLVITGSLAPQMVGTAENIERVEFPSAWLPAAFERVTYAVSAPVNWTFETADRTSSTFAN